MALSADLEKLLTYVPEAEREASRQRLTSLHENGLRQEDFSKKSNENAAEHKRNLTWYNQAKSEYDAATTELRQANEKIAALEAAKAAAAAAAAGRGNPQDELNLEDQNELAKQLKAAREEATLAKTEIAKLSGSLTTIDTMIKDGKLLTAEKFNEEVNKRGDALGAAVLDIWELQQLRQQEYGKPLTRQELLLEATKHNGDLHKAYDVITAPDKEAKMRKEIEVETEKRISDKYRNSNLPIAPGGESQMGPIQKMVFAKKDASSIPDNVPADGSGRLATLIAQELRAEGKG